MEAPAGLRCGLSLIGLSPRNYAEVAQAAETAGFDSIWIPEHLVLPAEVPSQYPYTADGESGLDPATPLLDPWVALAYVAAATTTIRLGTHVYILPLRHPFVTARSVVTLDRLSGGRAILGAGVGWLEPEFVATGQEFDNRGQRADEIIPLLRRLWSEEVIEHRGDHYDFDAVRFAPKPVQKPSIPIHVGGSSAPALRRAGHLGDGYIDIGATGVGDIAARIEVIHQHRRAAGRDDAPFEVTVSAEPFGDRNRHQELAALGVHRILAHPWLGGDGPGDVRGAMALIERFASTRDELGFA